MKARKILFVGLIISLMLAACQRAASTPPAPAPVIQTVVVEVPVTVTPNLVATNLAMPTSSPISMPTLTLTPGAQTMAEPADLWTNAASVVAYFNLKDANGTPLDVKWVKKCNLEETGKCWAILYSPMYASNPWPIWIEAFRHNPGIERPGNYTHPELSGLPPMAVNELLDSGMTIRPMEDYADAPGSGTIELDQVLTTIDVNGFPVTARAAATFYGINPEAVQPWVVGEKNQIVFRPLVEGGSFSVTNGACWMDGSRVNEGGKIRPGYENESNPTVISVPPNETVIVYEFVLRPCDVDQAKMLGIDVSAISATQVPVSSDNPQVAEWLELYSINPAEVNILGKCQGETGCYDVKAKGDYFTMTNPFGGWCNGYTYEVHDIAPGVTNGDGKIKIPPMTTIKVEAFSMRASCE